MMNPSQSPFFSIIVPVYNEAENLLPLVQEITSAMGQKGRSFELLFIDDGSQDGTPEALRKIQDPRVKFVSFRKNFGKSAALAYGFHHAAGKYAVTLDGDLQDDPGEIERMLEVLEKKNADVVCGWRKNRKDPFSKIISSRVFNFAAAVLTGVRVHDLNCGIKLYRRAAIKEIPMYGELHRYAPALAAWKGFVVAEHPVNHRPRRAGKSKFGMKRFWGGVVDLLTVVFMMRYEGKPSHLFSGTGLFLATAGLLINFHLLFLKIAGRTIAPRYPYMILGVTALSIGVQFIFFGLVSEMIVYASKSRNAALQFPIVKRDAE